MPGSNRGKIVTINGGSSSIKFAVYKANEEMVCELSGKLERIGQGKPQFSFTNHQTQEKNSTAADAGDFNKAAVFLIDWLEKHTSFDDINCIGHRMVHGLKHTHAEILTDELLADLHRVAAYDPDHLPAEIEMARAFKKRHPQLLQVACFDTAFHAGMPRVAKVLPIPARFGRAGVQKYGFHGLSCSYIMEALVTKEGTAAANGRVIIAHLGSGASITAVKNGQSVDTSMGFTPAGGLVMGTRSGDIDPGVAWYMMQNEHLTAEKFNQLINHESGLLGVSETSADMQVLLQRENTDSRAADATALFCYTVKKWTGSFMAVLGGLDILVFSGGIGENAAVVRSRICDGMGYAGIELDELQNRANATEISKAGAAVKVLVISTNEELMIAKSTWQIYEENIRAQR